MAERRFGRRTPSNKPAIPFSAFRRVGAVIPPHPSSVDYLKTLAHWNMLGNDQAGDCVAVTWANFRRLMTSYAGHESYPGQDQVWAFYKTQNPDFDPNGDPNVNGPGSSADQGMDIQTALEYLTHQGGPDGVKPVAFAKVDYTNKDELEAALAIFGGVWLGVNVQQAQMQQFDQGQPWSYVSGSPIDGGHSILAGGYKPDVTFITWAQETEFADSARQHLFEEAWVVIWPEHLGTAQFEAGVDVAALAQAYSDITGRPFPAPVPTPPAPPAPTPVPDPTPPPAPVPPQPPVPPEPGPAPSDPAFADWMARVKPVYDKFVKHPHKYWRQLKAVTDAWIALED